MLESDPKLTCDKRCSNPFKPSSGCTVVTKELIYEGELAIRTFQIHHNDVIVYVISDKISHEYLIKKNFSGPLKFIERELRIPDSVKKHNDYHRPDAILWKMEIFQMAVNQSGDSVFFDADIIFLEPLNGPQDCEVAISHNLPCLPAEYDGKLHGFFNAGLVWTCNPKFPGWWKYQYLNMGGFYEQVGMNMSPRLFRCGYFDFSHNYGFWRGPLGNREAKSFHLHLSTALDKTMPEFMLNGVSEMRKVVWKRFFQEHLSTCRIARRILNHPSKIFFIHYGKAGGVYVNHMMRREIIPEYNLFDSWVEQLGRDWTHEELRFILKESNVENNHYVHQHHVAVNPEHISIAKKHGWKTFSFIKSPLDIITSLYFWRKKNISETGHDIIFYDKTLGNISLQEFWRKIQEPDYISLWSIPDYFDDIDYVDEFSDTNFSKFLQEWFGYSHTPIDRMNKSENPGVAKLIEIGEISNTMIDEIASSKEYRRYQGFIQNKDK